jgi:hypothetical protein
MTDILMKLTSKIGKPLLNNDVLTIIKLFTGEIHYRNGKYIKINRIPKLDYRYEMLFRRPKIRQILNTDINDHRLKGSVWFKINNKFMVFNVGYLRIWYVDRYYDGYIKEIFYNNNVSVSYV